MRSKNGLLLWLCLCGLLLLTSSPLLAQRLVFPNDSSVLNAKRDFGAKGDGTTDDTAALQSALDASCGIGTNVTRVLFLPNGVYRVTKTLVIKSGLGPWLYGETRDGAVIRLDDNTTGVNSVLRTHPNESGPTSADWFMRNLRNFTVDVGNNPNTDGIRYFATNTGMLQNVHVKGNGKIGINAGFLSESGPNLIQDVLIEGFDTGIQSQWIWGETLSRITILNCRVQGVYVSANAVGIEDLSVTDTPLALFVDYPNDWTWWGGVVALLGAKFYGTTATDTAVKNRNVLYSRDVRLYYPPDPFLAARGLFFPFPPFLLSRTLPEAFTPDYKKQFTAPPAALGLPIKPEPQVPWETDLTKWVCANDYGVTRGDNTDDTAAFQSAIDAAALAGKTVVYLRGVGGGDPNWYTINGEVRVHGSVRVLMGLGWARIIGGPSGKIIVDDTSASLVKFQNLDSFGGTPVTLENRSAQKTMIVESCGVSILGTGTGDIFATDCSGPVKLLNPGQKMWARQLNPEGDSDTGLVQNNGASLWILGMKNEGKGVRVKTSGGGKTEISGVFNYGSGNDLNDTRPMFDVDNASFSVAGLREIAFTSTTFPVKVREKRGTETRLLTNAVEGGWIGWSLYSGYDDPAFPYPVTGLKALAGNQQILLKWDTMPGAASYLVKRGLSAAGPFVLAGSSSVPTFTDTGLTSGTRYFYTVIGRYGNRVSMPSPPVSAVSNAAYRINAGGGEAAPFSADGFVNTGGGYTVSDPIDLSGVTAPAPAAVYQSERTGAFTYTLPDLIPGGTYKLRLHFAEIWFGSAGQRKFSVKVNGTSVLTDFDVFASAAAKNKAVIREFTVTAAPQGTLTIDFLPSVDNPKLSGLELLIP